MGTVLERFLSCTVTMDDEFFDYEVPAYMYGDWAALANWEDDNGWRILHLTSNATFPYIFDTALEAAQWCCMLNGFNVDWDNLQSGDLTRIGAILTPLYKSLYREYTSVNAA